MSAKYAMCNGSPRRNAHEHCTHDGAFSSTLERDRFCRGHQHGVIKVAKRDIPRGGVSFDAGAVAAGVEGDVGALGLSSALLMPVGIRGAGTEWVKVERVVRARRQWSSEGWYRCDYRWRRQC